MKAEVKSQLSVVVPNKPGQIAAMSKMLLDAKINLQAVMFVDSQGQGIVRFIVDKTEEAKNIFEEAGFFVVVAEVVEVEFDNTPGALYELSKALGDAGINIDYAYGCDNPDPRATRVTFKLSDVKKGLEVVKKL